MLSGTDFLNLVYAELVGLAIPGVSDALTPGNVHICGNVFPMINYGGDLEVTVRNATSDDHISSFRLDMADHTPNQAETMWRTWFLLEQDTPYIVQIAAREILVWLTNHSQKVLLALSHDPVRYWPALSLDSRPALHNGANQ